VLAKINPGVSAFRDPCLAPSRGRDILIGEDGAGSPVFARVAGIELAGAAIPVRHRRFMGIFERPEDPVALSVRKPDCGQTPSMALRWLPPLLSTVFYVS
jgi:hypothetical protein